MLIFKSDKDFSYKPWEGKAWIIVLSDEMAQLDIFVVDDFDLIRNMLKQIFIFFNYELLFAFHLGIEIVD